MTPTAVIEKHEAVAVEGASQAVPATALHVPAPSGPEPEILEYDEPYGEVLCLEERLVIAPCSGRFRSSFGEYTVAGQYVTKGQVVGTVVSRDGEVRPVSSPFSGWVMGHLIPDGGPVRASAPVAWLRRQ